MIHTLLLSLVSSVVLQSDTLRPSHAPALPERAAAVVAAPTASDTLREIPMSDHTAGNPRDTTRQRPRAVEYSDWYARRLTIHRAGSYAMLPLFATQYALGNRLQHGDAPASWVRPAHVAVAAGVGAIFVSNTVTGVWNLWDSRRDATGRTRRWVHVGLMLAADAGFVWTGRLAGDATRSTNDAQRHRNVALGSMALSTVGAGLMWLWRN